MKAWKTISQSVIYENAFFTVNSEECGLPDGKKLNYYTIGSDDWVQILPIFENGDLLLIRQFRQASQSFEIEIPGGFVDPGEEKEKAAIRELEEETGHTTDKIELWHSHLPNPALMKNQLHLYVAKDIYPVGEQRLDPYEEIEFFRCNKKQLFKLIHQGEIRHSLVLASLSFYLCHELKEDLL